MRGLVTAAYLDWINGLKDASTRARIQVRVDRLVHGNPGNARALRGGVVELKIDFGPGYRVYYSISRHGCLILLLGGDKSSQKRDIERAAMLAGRLGGARA